MSRSLAEVRKAGLDFEVEEKRREEREGGRLVD